jgi:transcriptional regulator GlxA family with amidase domain
MCATSTDIGILTYSGVQTAAVYGLTDFFLTANRYVPEISGPQFRVSHWKSTHAGDGVGIDYCSDRDGPAALACFIVPPSLAGDSTKTPNQETRRWIINQHAAGAIACSVCAGAFHLADAGLFENRTVTTHWALKDALAARHPGCNVETDSLIIDDGDVVTAGGLMAWTDLGLKLIDRFAGPTVMLSVARFFLVDPGGREQRFYNTFAPQLHHGDKAVLRVQHWLQGHFSQRVSLRQLADKAGLTERTFLRRFHKATSLNPTAYLQLLRIGKARELLETTTLSFNEIAWHVGYSDPAAFRKIFRKQLGLNPGEYRRRFRLA